MQGLSLKLFHCLVLLGVLVPQLVLGIWAFDSRADLRDEARRTALRGSAEIAEHSGRVFDSYALSSDLFARVMHGWTREFAILHGREHLTRLVSQGDRTPILGIALLDRDGELLASTEEHPKANRAHRAYFRRAMESEGPVLTGAMRRRSTQTLVFHLSRKVVLGDGTVGVLTFYFRTGYFESLIASLSGRTSDFVTSIYLTNGEPLFRHPASPEPILLDPGLLAFQGSRPGTFEKPSAADGTMRIYGYTPLHRFGAVAVVGLDEPGIYAAWWERFYEWALLAAACSLGFGSLFWAALSRARAMRHQALTLAQEVALRTAQAEERARQAERADHAKTQFLASASHDLRQPLQALRFYLDLGRTNKSDPASFARVIEMADQALGGAEELLHGLTEISSLEAGIVRPQVTACKLNELLEPLFQEISVQTQAAGLRLRWQLSTAWVMTDGTLLRRMVRHLIGNAIRYTVRGDILVGCRRKGGQLRIDVIDTGIGIPTQYHERIFDDFFQIGNESRDRNKGLGLGLAVVRRSAMLLGHGTELHSVPGAGSRFSIYVDRATPAQIAEAKSNAASSRASAKAGGRAPAVSG